MDIVRARRAIEHRVPRRRLASALLALALVGSLAPTAAAQSVPVGAVVIANGWSSADSAVASALAAQQSDSRSGAVVLYAEAKSLPSRTAEFLQTRRPSRVTLVGGAKALSPAVESEIARLSGGTVPARIDGTDRFDTAAKAVPATAATFFVANGYSAADTGVAAALAALNSDAAVLLAKVDSLTEPTERILRERKPKRVEFVGGTKVLAASLADRVRELVPSISEVPRHAGSSRTDTAAAAAPSSTTTLVVANGWRPADTGVAAALAAITLNAAVLYATSTSLTTPTADRITKLQPKAVVLIGGTAALSTLLHRTIHCLSPESKISRVSGADRIDTAVRAALGTLTPVAADFRCGTSGGSGGGGGYGGGGGGGTTPGGGSPATSVKPGPPSGLTAEVRNNGLALSWTAPQANAGNITRYEVQYCNTEAANASCGDDDGEDWSEATSTGGRGTSFEITGLDNNKAYKTRVRAVGNAGESAWSPSVQGTPAPQPPDAPTVKKQTLTSSGLVVTWAKPAENGGGVSGYDVRYRVQASNSTWPTTWTAGPSTDKDTTTATIPGITSASLSQGGAVGQAVPASPGVASVTAAATAKYQVQVRAENDIGAGPWSAQPPDAPPKPTVSSLNQSLSMQWAMPTENGSATTGYDVRYRACTKSGDLSCATNPTWASNWSSHAHSGTGTTTTITGLTNGTAYQVQVRAKSARGAGDWSASGLGTPAARKPDAPGTPTLTPKSKSLEASWSAPAANDPSGITDYDVQYRIKDTNSTTPGDQPGAWTALNDTGNNAADTTTSATIGGLTDGTAYQVQVRAENSVGAGAWSASANSTPTAGSPSAQPPDPPAKPALRAVHQGLEVSWNPPAINGSAITGYGVRYRVKDTNSTTPGDQPGSWQTHSHSSTATAAVIASLPNGTAYQVQVEAISAAGNSGWSASEDGTPAAPKPDAPAAPSLTSTDSELGVSWTAPANNGSPITDYDVRYCDNSTGCDAASEWTELNDTGNNATDTSTSADIGSLTNGTAYQVQVRAANSSGGDSDWSNSASGIPAKAPAAPSAPTLGVLDVSLAVTWTKPTTNGAPITDYDVQYRVCTQSNDLTCKTNPTWGTWTSKAHIGTGTTATITKLTNGTAYQVQVRAANRAGQSGWSNSASAVPARVPYAPSKPTLAVWNAELRVSWTKPSGNIGSAITDYDVRHCVDSTGCDADDEWTELDDSGDNATDTSLSATIGGLTNDTAYHVQVRAGNGIGDGAWSASRTATPTAQKPDAPAAPSLTNADRELGVTWTAPEDNGADIDDYDVRYRPCTAADKTCTTSPKWGGWTEWNSGNTSTTLSTTITGVTNGTAYQVQVRAGNAKGDSAWSPSAADTPAAKPGAPSAPTLTVGDSSLAVSWTAPAANGSAITDYDVQYRACDATPKTCTTSPSWGNWTEWNASDTSTALSAAVTGLTNGTAYQVQVRATNGEGDSEWSGEASAVPAKAPDAPSAPTLVVWNKELRVSWTAPADNGEAITDYDVQYRACTATPKSCASSPTWGTWRQWNSSNTSTATNATITGLTNDTAYQVQVRAGNDIGDGAWSNSASGTPTAQKPDAPAKPTLAHDDESLSVSWSAPANNGASITDYDVRYCDNSTGCDAASEWTELNDSGDNATNTSRSADIGSLTNGTTYQVQVRAGNSVGDGAWSASATQYPSTSPDAPAKPSLTVQHRSLGVSWSAPSGDGGSAITDYDVRYCTNSTGCDAASEWTEWNSGNTSTTRSATITGLTNGTAYQVQVRAGNRSGHGSWSNSETATPAKVPDTPAKPSLTAQHQALAVSWTAPANNGEAITDYDVQYRACTATDKTCTNGPSWEADWTEWNANNTSTTIGATITGLTNGTAYQVQVRATNDVGDSAWSASASEYPSTTPGTPGTPTLTVADRGLSVSWTAPSSNGGAAITKYKVGRCSANCGTDSSWTVTTSTSTSASLTGLTNGTAYQVRVAATNRSGDSSWSTSATATPAKAPSRPSAPTLVVWNAELRVSWTAPADNGEDITDYDVRYCTNSTGCDAANEWTELNDTGDNATDTNLNATITGLTNDTAYQVQVRAGNDIGNSLWSASATATPTAQKPAAPAAPTLTHSNQSISASWTAPTNNGAAINDYDVRYRACTKSTDLTCDGSTSNSDWGSWQTHSHTGTGTTANIGSLTNGTAYQVQVRAGNSKGKSAWSPSAAKTPSAKPGTPSAPTLTVGDVSLGVSWTAPDASGSPITDYDVQYRACTATPKSCTSSPSWGSWTEWNASDTSTTLSATITGLTNGTAYQVQVRATNGEGDSAWSESSTKTPAKAPDAPSAPTLVVWNAELRVSWTAPEANGAPISDYDVQYRACTATDGDSDVLTCANNPTWGTWTNRSSETDSDTTASATLGSLTNDTAYQVRVRAANSVGESAWSGSTKATPTAQKPATPGAPSLTHGDEQLTVSWSAPDANGSAITDYDVQYRACTATDKTCTTSPAWANNWTEWNASNTSTTLSATITGLTNGTAYQVQVRATNGKGDSAWSTASSEHPSAVPAAPGAPTLAVQDLSLGVSWSAPAANGSAITDYDVQYRACTATDKTCTTSPAWGSWAALNDTGDNATDTDTSATISSLTNGTAYQVQVRAGNRSGDGGWSASTTATPAKAPDAPSSVTVTARHQGLGVSWTAPNSNGAAITDYDVQYRACTNTNDLTCKTNPDWADTWTNRGGETSTDTATSVTIGSLTNGTAYQVRVRAENSVSESTWSSVASGTPAIQAPDAPDAPGLTVWNRELRVSWSQPTTNGAAISDYDVRYRACTSTPKTCASNATWGGWTTLSGNADPGTSTNATIGSLTNGTAYQVQVRAQNSVGKGAWSDSTTASPAAQKPAKPDAPTLAHGNESLTVSWTAPAHNGANISDYDVRHRIKDTNSTTPGDQPGSWTELDDTTDSTARSATVTGLTNGTTYQVQVRAGNSVGDGEWSDSATEYPSTTPGKPAAPGLTVGDQSLALSWAAPTGNGGSALTGYKLRYRVADTNTGQSGNQPGTWQSHAHTGTGTTSSITGLNNATAYDVQVRATNRSGSGGWSDSATATPAKAPAAPAAPGLTVGDESLAVTWTAPADNGSAITDYDVRYQACTATPKTCTSSATWGSWTTLTGNADPGTSTSASISSLTNGTAYQVEVRATNAQGTSSWSSAASAIPADEPSKPAAPTVTVWNQQLNVSWTEPATNGAPITDYDVQYRACTKAGDLTCAGANPTWASDWTDRSGETGSDTTASATLSSLTNDTAYQVRVRAANSQGESAWSDATKATPTAQKPDAPTKPTVAARNVSLAVSWTAPAANGKSISDYDVQYQACTATDKTCGTSPSWSNWTDRSGETTSDTDASVTVTGLTNGTKYRVRVRAANSVGEGAWSTAASGTPTPQRPDAPAAATVTVWNKSLNVSWTAPAANGASINDYDVRRRVKDTNTTTPGNQPGSWTELDDTTDSTALSATITGLTNGTTYEVQIRAGNSVGDGDWSASADGTPAAQKPAKPGAPTLTAGAQQIAVSWTAPANNGAAINDYDVRRRACTKSTDLTCSGSTSDSDWGSWAEWNSGNTSTSLSATITGLTNGTAYQVQVRAGNSVGDGAWSTSASTSPKDKPARPAAPTVGYGDQSLSVSWTAPADNGAAITDYDVRHRIKDANTTTPGDQPGPWTALDDTGNNATDTDTSATITGLTNGTAYQVQVRAGNSVGDSSWSTSTTEKPSTVPGTPAAPTLAVNDESLGVSWSAPTGNGGSAITDYDVRYCTNSTGCDGASDWTALDDTGNNASDTDTSATISSLTNGTAYQVQIRAGNRSGDGEWSASATATPAKAPNAPTAPTVAVWNKELRLSWSEPTTNGASITDYDVQYRACTATDSDTSVLTCATNPTWASNWSNRSGETDSDTTASATVSSLTNGTAYQVRVRAANSVGEGAWSTATKATPTAQKPDAPAAPTLTVDNASLDVTWTAPADNGAAISDYDVRYRACTATPKTCAGANPTWGGWSTLSGNADPGTSTSAAIGSLTNGTAYQIQIQATNSVGDSGWSAAGTASPAPQKPDAPAAPTVVVWNKELRLSWTAPTNNGAAITDHDVRYRACTATPKTCASNPTWGAWTDRNGETAADTATSATVSGLTNDTAYQVQIRAANSVGESTWSTPTKATPTAQKPDAPAAPTATVWNKELRLSWTAPTNNGATITDYDVQYRACTKSADLTCASNPTWGAWTDRSGETAADTATSVTVSGLTNDTAYQVQIRAANSVGESAWSTAAKATPTAQKPEAPAAPTVTAKHQGLAVSWTAPTDNGAAISDYDVQYRACTATPKSCATNPTWGAWTDRSGETAADTATSVTVTGLTNATAHEIRVRAANSVGEGTWSTSGTGTPAPQRPDAPTVTATAKNESIAVSWTAAANGSTITDYDVRYRACTATPKTCASNATWGSWTTLSGSDDPGTSTSVTIDSLTNGTAYRVQVRATNGIGTGGWSASSQVAPAPQKPDAPAAPTVSYRHESLHVSWTAPAANGAAIADYDVRHRACTKSADLTCSGSTSDTDWGSWTNRTGETATDTATSVTIGSLTNGTAYQVQVRAANSVGESGWSPSGTGTPTPKPARITDLTVTTGDRFWTATWTAPSGPVVQYAVHATRWHPLGWWNHPPHTYTSKGKNNTSLTRSGSWHGIENGKLWRVQVATENLSGWSQTSEWVEFYVIGPPPVPTDVSLAVKSQGFDVTWTSPANSSGGAITDYDVQYRACTKSTDLTCSGSTGDTDWGSWTEWNAGNTSTTTSASITGLTNGTAYQVQVRSTNSAHDSAWSASATAVASGKPAAPSAPTLTVKHQSLGVSWTEPTTNGGAITDYDVQYRACTKAGDLTCAGASPTWGDWASHSHSGTGTSATITGLTNSTAYQVQVRATNAAGTGGWSASAKATPAPQPPEAPSAPSVTVWNKELRLSWTAPSVNGSAITDYDVQYRACTATPLTCATNPTWGTWTEWNAADTSTTLSATVTALTNDTAYEVQVRAGSAAGDGAWSASTKATPTAQKPEAPDAPTLAYGNASLDVSWTAPADNGAAVNDYDVRYRPCTKSADLTCATSPTWGSWTEWNPADTSTALSATVTALTNGTAYQVQVRAGNSVGDGAWSASSDAEYPSTVPDAPAAPTVGFGSQVLNVSWSAPSSDGGDDISGYKVGRCSASCDTASSWTISTLTGTGTTTSLTGLTNGVSYQVRVAATNRDGDSAWSSTTSQSPAYRPGKPDAPTLTRGNQQITASWTEPADGGADISGYVVNYREEGKSIQAHSHSGTGTSTTITGLTNGKRYAVSIQAKNKAGNSDWSGWSAWATPATVPSAPSAPSLAYGAAQLTVSWTAPTNNGDAITDYDVQYRICTKSGDLKCGSSPTWGSWQDHAHTGTAVTATITGLTNGTAYQARVRATNEPGTGAWSGASAKQHPSTTPGAPAAPTLSVDHASLDVSWSAPSSTGGSAVTDYDVQYRACNKSGDLTCATNPTWGAWTSKAHTGTGTTTTITGLTNGTAYQVQVRAGNRSGAGTWSASAKASPTPQKPAKPAKASLTVKHQALDVSWSAPNSMGSAITDYDVQYRACTASTGLDCKTAPTSWGNWADRSGETAADTGTSASLTGLTNGTAYQVRVRAANVKGESGWSNIAEAIPATLPGTPGRPTLTAGALEIAVSWTAPSANGGSPITGYKVQYCDNSTGCDADNEWTTRTSSGTGTTYTLDTLTNGVTYRVRVAATNSVGDSTWSAYRTGTPKDKPATPEAPTVVSGDRSLSVSWTAPASNGSNITGYKVRWCGGETAECHNDESTDWKEKSSSSTSTSISSLTNGTSYQVRVRARNALGSSDWSSDTTGTPGAPATPGAPSLTEGNGSLTASWSAPSNRGDAITDYGVGYCDSTSSTCTSDSDWTDAGHYGTATSYEISSLTNGTTYKVRVRAQNTRGWGGWSTARSGTPATVPGQPDSPTVATGDRTLTASWTAPTQTGGSAITGYSVRYCVNSTGCTTANQWTVRTVSSASTTSYAITGLTNGTEYQVAVAAKNGKGLSEYSYSTNATPAALPSKPTSLAVTAGHQSLAVSWTASVDNGSTVTGYQVEYRKRNSDNTWPATWTSHDHSDTSTSTTILSLTNGSAYQVRVQATSDNGNSGWTSAVTGTPAAVPDAPDEPTLTTGNGTINVSWSAPHNDNGSAVTGYAVQYRKQNADSTWPSSWTSLSHTGTGTTAAMTSLTNGRAYQVQVRAKNANGSGPWSSTATATPAGAPSQVGTPTVTAGDDALTVSWTAPASNGSAITGYSVEYCTSTDDCTNDDNWTDDSPGGTETSHEITGLSNGTTYKVRVRATNGEGSGLWSSEVSGTPVGKPSAPDTVEIVSGNARLIVTWSAPTSNGATVNGFKLRYCNTDDTSKDCSSDKDDWTTVNVSGGSTRTKTITGLTNGDNYDFDIATTSSNGGNSDWSANAAFGKPGGPSAPSTPTLTAGDGQITVTWTAAAKNHSDIQYYEVGYCNNTPVDNNTPSDCASGTWFSDQLWLPGTLTLDLTGLDNGKSYKVRVRAQNQQGAGLWSSTATATPSS